MYKPALKKWLGGLHSTNLAQIITGFYSDVARWLTYPLTQKDPLTCSYLALSLLAKERGVAPILGESEELFRKRVHFSFLNAKDAGSVAGLKRILARLGFGEVTITERQPGYDWDEVIVQMSDSQLSGNQELLARIVQQYGRTCRRYRITNIQNNKLGRSAYGLGYSHNIDIASI